MKNVRNFLNETFTFNKFNLLEKYLNFYSTHPRCNKIQVEKYIELFGINIQKPQLKHKEKNFQAFQVTKPKI